MKKPIILLILFLLALVGASYLYYTHWRSEQQTEASVPYIPQSAALVYEVANFNKQWGHFQQTAIGQSLSPLPSFGAIQETLGWLKKEILEDAQRLAGVPLVLSVHGLEAETCECLFYFNMHSIATQRLLEAVTAKIDQDKAYNKEIREYAGHHITTLSKQGAGKHLSYIQHDQYLIASFSSLLLEEVVHGLANKRQSNFLRLQKSTNSQGSLYINWKELPQLLRVFVQPGQVEALSTSLATFSQTSQLNVKLTQHHLLLSGFAQASSRHYLSSTLAGQTAGSMLLAPCLPQSAAVIQHVTFSNPQQLFAAWQQYRTQAAIQNQEAPDLLTATLEPLLQEEIGHCTLAPSQGQRKGQLVFMKVTDPQAFTEALKGARLFADFPLQRLGIPAKSYELKTEYFQHWLPGLLFPGFVARYFTQMDDYIVLADGSGTLQTWHTQCQQGKTWANNPRTKDWLATTLDQAQWSLFVDVPQIWSQLMQALKPAWKQVIEPHARALRQFSQGSLQLLQAPQGSCYMSVLLKHKETKQPQKKRIQRIAVPAVAAASDEVKTIPNKALYQTEAPLIHDPWLVKSHREKGQYTLLQDAKHQLYLLAPSGKLLWKKSLEGPITTEVFEIDFYKNNKTQYLFATAGQLHLLDYYGRPVRPYPQSLPQPAQLQVVDYNQDKEYRFLLATAQGDIYLKDKQYKPLPGWNPCVLKHEFSGTPFHLRERGKDYFLALQTNGTLQVLNRKGKNYPGFPVELKTPVHQRLAVRKTAAGVLLTVITDEGKQIDIKLY